MDIFTTKYPAKAHARRVAAAIKAKGQGDSGIIYLEGQKDCLKEDSDEHVHFRQRRNFFYLSGCQIPDSYLTYNIAKDELTLFIPPLDPDSVIWSGLPVSPADALKRYDVDKVFTSPDVNAHLAQYCAGEDGAKKVFAIADRVSPEITFLPFQETDFEVLKQTCEECRVVKDEYEIALLRHANKVSSDAHIAVMKSARGAKNEREMEATFRAHCLANDCRDMSYDPIFARGPNGATLHYQANDAELNDTSMSVLVDAGAQHRTYCADITRAFPLSGKFSPEARQIYDIVLDMHASCIEMIKGGALWDDIHAHAHKVAIKGLLKLGILKGSPEELFEKRVSVAFFPHGLGHHLGMDTHDVGGNPNSNDPNPMFRYLRLRGIIPTNSVVTIEPGVYFCGFIIEPYLKSAELGKYIDKDVLDKYWSVGGVRIEDNVVVTETGYDNLTTVPKAIDEVEKLVQEGQAIKY